MKDEKAINCLRGLIVNGVHKANSGHPGGALSSLDFAYILFKEYLRFNPKDPEWFGRDRFVLSAGHESMLLYSLLFGTGWLEKEDLGQFRSFASRTPGHPENHVTPGVECTTGPLGQGAAMSVGFSLASKHLSSAMKSSLFQTRTFSLLGDGCMQEEIVSGAASLAGHLGLSNLVWYYDKNNEQISGSISRSISCDFKKAYEASGWDVLEINGHSHTEIRKSLDYAETDRRKPLLIIGETTMAKGTATMEGSHKTHGAPLPEKERLATLEALGIPVEEDFYWPEEAKNIFQENFSKKEEQALVSQEALRKSLKEDKDFQEKYEMYFSKNPESFLPEYRSWKSSDKLATRSAFGELLESWSSFLPGLIGGSADLDPSNMTEAFAKKVHDFSKENHGGRNLAFGVREFTMSAVCNGIALYGGFIPFDATFLTFSDYSRAALRLGAIQKTRVIHEFTHDSFYVGEDGPTHQPVEHLMSLRLIPDLYVFRPADANETEVLFRKSLSLKAPSCLCLSRQKLPVLDVSLEQVKECVKGAWTVYGGERESDYIFFASGSEVHLALDVAKELENQKIGRVKVVSLSSWELFSEQEESYQEKILETSCEKRISIEAGTTLGWERFVGMRGLKIGLDRFGASAPAGDLEKAFGFTKEAVLEKVKHHFEKVA